jgi:hypothetical protein
MSTLKLDVLVDELVMERFRDVEEGETKGEPRPNYCGALAAAEHVAMRMLFAYDDRVAGLFTAHLINAATAFHRHRVQQGIETPDRLQVTIVNCVLDPLNICVAALRTNGVEEPTIHEAVLELQARKRARVVAQRLEGAVIDVADVKNIGTMEIGAKPADGSRRSLRLVQNGDVTAEVVPQLPRTVDGVLVGRGMVLWDQNGDGWTIFDCGVADGKPWAEANPGGNMRLEALYSTKEAALLARAEADAAAEPEKPQ